MPYDVLHYCGHCVYDPSNREKPGWLFTGGEILSADELDRIDRIPKFVFSNACESGVTPDRSEDRSPGLGASFAEEFFKRGVSNFVCTAWPVNDRAARQFARRLYSGLLGIVAEPEPADPVQAPIFAASERPEFMHEAMSRARQAIADTPTGLRT